MANIRLRVISDYHCRDVYYSKGTTLDLAAEAARWLCADAPGAFEMLADPAPFQQAMDKPPMDKMIRSAPVRKGKVK